MTAPSLLAAIHLLISNGQQFIYRQRVCIAEGFNALLKRNGLYAIGLDFNCYFVLLRA
jgi:hypothetical protein